MSCKSKLVGFKETTCCVNKHRVSNTVDKIINTNFDFLTWLGALDGFLEYDVKGLRRDRMYSLRELNFWNVFDWSLETPRALSRNRACTPANQREGGGALYQIYIISRNSSRETHFSITIIPLARTDKWD